ncbi:MAG: hypothetical protein AB7F96_22290 [Beijerinckiaceae bacterium]
MKIDMPEGIDEATLDAAIRMGRDNLHVKELSVAPDLPTIAEVIPMEGDDYDLLRRILAIFIDAYMVKRRCSLC